MRQKILLCREVSMSKALHRQAGRYGGLKKNLDADDPRVVDAHRQLVALQLCEHVADVLSGAPALTPEQIENITSVLAGVRHE